MAQDNQNSGFARHRDLYLFRVTFLHFYIYSPRFSDVAIRTALPFKPTISQLQDRFVAPTVPVKRVCSWPALSALSVCLFHPPRRCLRLITTPTFCFGDINMLFSPAPHFTLSGRQNSLEGVCVCVWRSLSGRVESKVCVCVFCAY